jgi:hypothetical protein
MKSQLKTWVVNLEKLEEAMRYIKQMNEVPLEEIIWLRNGEVVHYSEKQIADWKWIGLSNAYFPEHAEALKEPK